jgi:Family of unknown function (DUF5996)
LQHAALLLTAHGWETGMLPAPDGSGALVVTLDLRAHEVVAEHSDGRTRRVSLTHDRPVGAVTRELLAAVGELVRPVAIDTSPQEVPRSAALDEDEEHRTYDPTHVATYFAAATRAALVLADFRGPYRGRCSPVNAWWGSFDLAVNPFSGVPADPPSQGFIMRKRDGRARGGVRLVAWRPELSEGPRSTRTHPAPQSSAVAALAPELGEFVLEWDDVCASSDPRAFALISHVRRFVTHASSASGIPSRLRAPRAGPRRSPECRPTRCAQNLRLASVGILLASCCQA